MNTHLQEIDLGIGLDDSEIISYNYESEPDKITLKFKACNMRIISIHFHEVLLFAYRCRSEINRFCEDKSNSPEFLNIIRDEYDNKEIPNQHPYKRYMFIDINDDCSIYIMCKETEIIYL